LIVAKENTRKYKKKCPVCERIFSEYYLEVHMRKHTGVKTDFCKICGKSLNSKHGVYQHLLLVHGHSRNGQYECPLCIKKWMSVESFGRHLMVKHRINKKSNEFKELMSTTQ